MSIFFTFMVLIYIRGQIMTGYNYNSIVSRHEAEALKEMIFKRARERAEALAKDVQEEYTSSAQNDVMEIARNSFVASKNPFSLTAEVKTPENKTNSLPPDSVSENDSKAEEVGFPPRKADAVVKRQEYKIKNSGEEIIKSTIESNMNEARSALSKKQSFMGALNFLNAQATVALIKKNGQSFEALA